MFICLNAGSTHSKPARPCSAVQHDRRPLHSTRHCKTRCNEHRHLWNATWRPGIHAPDRAAQGTEVRGGPNSDYQDLGLEVDDDAPTQETRLRAKVPFLLAHRCACSSGAYAEISLVLQYGHARVDKKTQPLHDGSYIFAISVVLLCTGVSRECTATQLRHGIRLLEYSSIQCSYHGTYEYVRMYYYLIRTRLD